MDAGASGGTRARTALILLLAGAGLVAGWAIFYFLTDDAYIAFRYAANARAGRGLVWNPPPFEPVEGYTSFLWVLLLWGVWWLTGVEPPDASGWISLGFGAGILWLGYRLIARMQLPRELERDRLALFAAVVIGAESNRTFLAWLSSGLETAMFNFLLVAFVVEALAPEARRASPWWVTRLSACAALAALTRPDGMLVVACAALILLWDPGPWARPRRLAHALPLLAVPAHLAWRRATYGEWLPNTYYAKYTGPWPESGARYLASFVVEYGLWLWLLIALAWCVSALRGLRRPLLARLWSARNAFAAVGLLLAHAAYYTFVVGGDHFEYRVYSQLVIPLWVSAIWMLVRLGAGRRALYASLVAMLVVSLPIPWLHWSGTRELATRRETFKLVHPIAQRFPFPIDRAVAVWDGWQRWLIEHNVCMRHQEHKIFQRVRSSALPTREEGARIPWRERNVFAEGSVGVVGWTLPNVAILDTLGLNDRVIARLPPPERPEGRQMAHDREAPAAYVRCFRPNVSVVARERRVVIDPRPLPDARIRECETRAWSRQLDGGRSMLPGKMDRTAIPALLGDLARKFPGPLIRAQLEDVQRIAFQIGLVLERAGTDVDLCDIGAGVGLFGVGCAKLGMRVTMIDDYAHPYSDGHMAAAVPDAPDAVNYELAEQALDLHRSLGVNVERRDPLVEGFGFARGSLDVVTSFDSMEHWHRSPKGLFGSAIDALVPGGVFILGAPNCVNLRKRITVPLGRGKWSPMAHWYETESFRGHVREPDVEDLRYIARSLDLCDVEILGRNWAGYISPSRAIRAATAATDHLLRLRPSLCSDLYLVGRKPA